MYVYQVTVRPSNRAQPLVAVVLAEDLFSAIVAAKDVLDVDRLVLDPRPSSDPPYVMLEAVILAQTGVGIASDE